MSRTLWTTVLLLCVAATVGSLFYSLRAPGGQLLPLLVAMPFVILAKIAWRQIRRPA